MNWLLHSTIYPIYVLYNTYILHTHTHIYSDPAFMWISIRLFSILSVNWTNRCLLKPLQFGVFFLLLWHLGVVGHAPLFLCWCHFTSAGFRKTDGQLEFPFINVYASKYQFWLMKVCIYMNANNVKHRHQHHRFHHSNLIRFQCDDTTILLKKHAR